MKTFALTSMTTALFATTLLSYSQTHAGVIVSDDFNRNLAVSEIAPFSPAVANGGTDGPLGAWTSGWTGGPTTRFNGDDRPEITRNAIDTFGGQQTVGRNFTDNAAAGITRWIRLDLFDQQNAGGNNHTRLRLNGDNNFSFGIQQGQARLTWGGATNLIGVADEGRFVSLVLRLDFNVDGGTNERATLFVSEQGQAAPLFQTSLEANLGIDTFGNQLQVQRFGGPTGTFDNLVLATSFGDLGLVPEPSTGLLAGFGLFGLVMRRKTRSRV